MLENNRPGSNQGLFKIALLTKVNFCSWNLRIIINYKNHLLLEIKNTASFIKFMHEIYKFKQIIHLTYKMPGFEAQRKTELR